jgi:hypothetical protein
MTHLLVWYDKSAKARRNGLDVQPIGRFTMAEAIAATELEADTLKQIATGKTKGLAHGKFWTEGERA